MICLIDAERKPAESLTSKLLRRLQGHDGVRGRRVAVLGMRAFYVTIENPQGARPREIKNLLAAAAGRIRAQRIGAVVFSESFPYREFILREGFKEVDEGPLIEALAGTIAENAAARKKCAVLFANRLSSSALRVLNELCRSFRIVMLESDAGEDACQALRRQLGVSIILNPPPDRMEGADVAVFLSAPSSKTTLSEKTVVISSDRAHLQGVSYTLSVDGVDIELPDGALSSVPGGFETAPIAAAALDCGAVSLEDIRLSGIRYKQPSAAFNHNGLTRLQVLTIINP